MRDNQTYRIFRIRFEDGTTRDYPFARDPKDELEGILDTNRNGIPDNVEDPALPVRDTAQWLTMQRLFQGTMPGTPKAVRVVAEWVGPAGSQP